MRLRSVLFVYVSFLYDTSASLDLRRRTNPHTHDGDYAKSVPRILSYDTSLMGSSTLSNIEPKSQENFPPNVHNAPHVLDRNDVNQHTPTQTPTETEIFRKQPLERRDIPEPTPPPSSALKDNDMCVFLGAALGICNSLTPGFTTMGPSMQAQCLCYSSAAWSPYIFDNAVGECAAFASTAATLAYAPLVDLGGFCASVGDVKAPKSTLVTTTSSIPAVTNTDCDVVTKALVSCAEKTVGFENLDATGKAKCLCYDRNTSWRPTQFDNAVKTCAENANFSTSLPLVQPLAGLCGYVGNVLGDDTRTTVILTSVPESSKLPTLSLEETTILSTSIFPITTTSDLILSSTLSILVTSPQFSKTSEPSSTFQSALASGSDSVSQSSWTIESSSSLQSTTSTISPQVSTSSISNTLPSTMTVSQSTPQYIPSTILNTPSLTPPSTGIAVRREIETWEIILISFCCAMVLVFLC